VSDKPWAGNRMGDPRQLIHEAINLEAMADERRREAVRLRAIATEEEAAADRMYDAAGDYRRWVVERGASPPDAPTFEARVEAAARAVSREKGEDFDKLPTNRICTGQLIRDDVLRDARVALLAADALNAPPLPPNLSALTARLADDLHLPQMCREQYLDAAVQRFVAGIGALPAGIVERARKIAEKLPPILKPVMAHTYDEAVSIMDAAALVREIAEGEGRA